MPKLAHEGWDAITSDPDWPFPTERLMVAGHPLYGDGFPPRTVEDEHGGEWLSSVDTLLKSADHVLRYLKSIDRPDEAEIVRMLIDGVRAAKLENRWLPSRGFSK